MRKLELEPESYEEEFTALTKGVNLKIKKWIIDKIGESKAVLEVGCGTGALASTLALKNNEAKIAPVSFNRYRENWKNTSNVRREKK